MKWRSVLAVAFVLLAVFGAVASAAPRAVALTADTATCVASADSLEHAVLAVPSTQLAPSIAIVDIAPPLLRELDAPRARALTTAPKTSPPR